MFVFQNPSPFFGSNLNNYAYITCCSSKFVPQNIAACESDPSKIFSPRWFCEQIKTRQKSQQVCDCHAIKSPFTFNDKLNGISESCVFLFVTFALYLSILVMIEFGVFRKLKSWVEAATTSALPASSTGIDEDVATERARVKDLMKQPKQT